MPLGEALGALVFAAWGVISRSSSRLPVWKRLLLAAVAFGAFSWESAWGQVSETLPEVTVTAPRPAPRPPRRAEPAPRRAAPSRSVAPAPVPAAPAPVPAVTTPSPFQFVAPTPVTGLGIDRNKVPAMVQTLPAEDFSRTYSPNVVETFAQRIPGVTTNNVQGNEFATDLRYRGFAASPLQGTPQGLAVYMQGIRINEAFGDTVNWDLIPKVAIGRSDIWTNNPTFGLNALGGAISFQMKDGFTYNGTEFDASGGSYGRVGGSLQYGVRNGEWGLYLAAEGLKDDGWRYQSPSRLARFYGDLGWKGTDAEIHLVTSAADNFFGVIGPTPIELLANDYRAIFTWPQTTKNEAALVALNGRYSVTDHWTVQSNLYYRRFNQEHVDGNAAEIERCSGAANNPLFNTLCLENDAFPQPRPPAAAFQILNQNGQPIPCPPGGGNTCATTPWGTVDRTFTKGLTTGASLQALNDDKVLGHDNYFVIGASVDRSKIGFLGNSELGFIYPDLFVGPNAAVPGTGQIIHTAADIGFSPVSLVRGKPIMVPISTKPSI
jgi:iron complex outermembrane recepter protein